MGITESRNLFNAVREYCPFFCSSSQFDVESGLMSSSTAVPENENDEAKKVVKSMINDLKQAQIQILSNAHVEVVSFKRSSSYIELEWCGTIYSGKFGSLTLPNDSYSCDEQLQKEATVQDADSFLRRKLICKHIGSAATYSETHNYSIDQIKSISEATKKEAEHLNNLKNGNIIEFFGIFYEEDKLPILIVESVQWDLDEYVAEQQYILWNNIFMISQGISRALHYLHEVKNMVHNNLCTKSIVLTKAFVAKLTSFELAVAIPDDATTQQKDHSPCNMLDDVQSFGEVLMMMSSCTQHEKIENQVFKKIKDFADECLRRKTCSSKIFKTIEEFRNKYESVGDETWSVGDETCNGSANNNSVELPERLTKENEALKNQLEQLELKLLQMEEKRFKLTNAFTTVDSRSPLKISEEYRHMQQHVRAAAARAHRKLYKNCNPVPFHDHTMIAYNKAKELILIASKQYIEKSLFDLSQPDENLDVGDNTKDLVSIELMIDKLYDDHSFTVRSISTIEKALTEEYKLHVNQQDVPAEVKSYYTKLAELTWNAVAKAIPMVLSVEEEYYNEAIHELMDELEDDFDPSVPCRVKYVYPVLFTSNNHPREVAIKGKVKLA